MKDREFKMKKIRILTILLVAILLMFNCEEEKSPSVWDPDDKGAPNPEISELAPPDSQFGGVGDKKLVTINGENFHSHPDSNFVYFGKMMGDVIEASETQLKVAAPANYEDSLAVKLAVHGAYLFGKYGDSTDGEFEYHPYKLISPVSNPGKFSSDDNPGGICLDSKNNLFVVNGPKGKSLDKLTPEGNRIYYGNLVQPSSRIILGPNGAMYYAYLNYILKTDTTAFDPTVDRPDADYTQCPSAVIDFTFDQNDNLYVINKFGVTTVNSAEFSIIEEYELFAGDSTLITGRVYNDELYLIGDNTDQATGPFIWKYTIDPENGTLTGSMQEVLDFSTTQNTDIDITSIEFNTEGAIYVGTTTHSLLKSDVPSSGVFTQVFPQILGEHNIHLFKWSEDNYIYINTKNSADPTKTRILKLMLFEQGAAHYGRE
jgi:hypothetical protein